VSDRERLQIRTAVADDAATLSDLIGELGYPASAEELRRRFTLFDGREGSKALVAVLDGRVVGMLTLETRVLLHRPGPIGRISSLVIDEACRGREIGRALVEAAEADCAAAGCVLVEVTSNDKRTRAHAFYERLGYERTSVRFAKTL
jgi:ribosomal protein S18 acetylase RimI-like enzyme